jgi:hypothetical protein
MKQVMMWAEEKRTLPPPTTRLFHYVFQRASGDASDKIIKCLEMFAPPDKKFPQAKIRFKITDANSLRVCQAGIIKFYSQSCLNGFKLMVHTHPVMKGSQSL